MSRKRKEDALKTREQILSVALILFAQKGYDKATFIDIASHLQMTKGAVYYYFASKEALLLALVDEMCQRFQREIISLMPDGSEDLSFPAVAKAMVEMATRVVTLRRGRDFFLLMHEQIRWSSSSMDDVRERLLKNTRFGPWEAIRAAVESDKATNRIKKDVDSKQIASTCLALWNGLIHSQIAHFLPCDLEKTLTQAFMAIYHEIQI